MVAKKGHKHSEFHKRMQIIKHNCIRNVFEILTNYTTTAGALSKSLTGADMSKFKMSVMFISKSMINKVTRFCLFKRSTNHNNEKSCIQAGQTRSVLSNKRLDVSFICLKRTDPNGAQNDPLIACCPRSIHLSSCLYRKYTDTPRSTDFLACLLALCQASVEIFTPDALYTVKLFEYNEKTKE